MLKINIPGWRELQIKNVVFDYNGTLAEDGIIRSEVKEKIERLSDKGLNIYVLTADTYGCAKQRLEGLPIELMIFNNDNAAVNKKRIVEEIGSDLTVAIGNGMNDVEMFKVSSLSIAVIGREGCSVKALAEADIVVNDILDAIELLLKPERIVATLRR